MDLGSNTGISVVYWAWRYPAAKIDAPSIPHPVHLAMLDAHLKLNRIGSRVAVHPVAVGTSGPEAARLTDEQGSSRIEKLRLLADSPYGLSISSRLSAAKEIDLLKIDIEGAEYDIFMDPRFAELDLGSIAFEWHNYSPHQDANSQIFSRLERLGWHTACGPESADRRGQVGIGYAYR